MNDQIEELAQLSGVSFTDYQVEAFTAAAKMPGERARLCLCYKTGAGKSLTSLVCVALWGYDTAVVIAPPSTHVQWEEAGRKLGIEIQAMSHARFRMSKTKLGRDVPVIADEMHMFGGHRGKGWMKLDRLAGGLKAPMVLASATPSYNDAERVYCVQHVMDPFSCRGGFLQFLYQHCETEQNPFAATPDVVGFHHFDDAEAYLAALPGVMYLPDDVVFTIAELEVEKKISSEMELFGYNRRDHRMIASIIEKKHTVIFQSFVDSDGVLYGEVYDILIELAGQANTPLLVYCNHSTVADALGVALEKYGVEFAVVTGKTSKPLKNAVIQQFKDGDLDVLVGTASLATGTDGMDKMCDWLVILDDTEDDSLRRQLIGRIMPRGLDTDATGKNVVRINLV